MSGDATTWGRLSVAGLTMERLAEEIATSIGGVALEAGPPLDGEIMQYNAGAGEWQFASPGAPGAHVLADTTGLGASHTTSGLTAGFVLRATGATTAAFQALVAGDIPSLDAAKITTGTFADARISESSVTQHEAALSIATSQLTGTLAASAITYGTFATSVDANGYVIAQTGSAATPTLTLKSATNDGASANTTSVFSVTTADGVVIFGVYDDGEILAGPGAASGGSDPAFFSGSGVGLTDIPETAITDGSILARVAGNETISGAWNITGIMTVDNQVKFNNPPRLQIETGDPFSGISGYATLYANAGGVLKMRDGTGTIYTIFSGGGYVELAPTASQTIKHDSESEYTIIEGPDATAGDTEKNCGGLGLGAHGWNDPIESVVNYAYLQLIITAHGSGTPRGYVRLWMDDLADGSDTGFFRVQNANGYVDIGPETTSYTHLTTDRSAFLFNKRLRVDEGIISSHDEDLALQRAGTTKLTFGASDSSFADTARSFSTDTITTTTKALSVTQGNVIQITMTNTSSCAITLGTPNAGSPITLLLYASGGARSFTFSTTVYWPEGAPDGTIASGDTQVITLLPTNNGVWLGWASSEITAGAI